MQPHQKKGLTLPSLFMDFCDGSQEDPELSGGHHLYSGSLSIQKSCMDHINKPLGSIINQLLTQGTFYQSLKQAFIHYFKNCLADKIIRSIIA